jgi:hypothetical protein
MTSREYAKQNRHIGEAWEDGKTIEYFDDRDNKWIDWTKSMRPVFCASAPRWRIKPEPPQPKYRAWKPEEVPVGCIVSLKHDTARISKSVLFHCNGVMVWTGFDVLNPNTLDDALKWWDHSTDGGKTWRPCGVEVKE